MTDLAAQSVALILASQAPSGAYPAAPHYPTYKYCWFRDGAYIAHAMDLVGEHDSATQFHSWVAEVINARAKTIERTVLKQREDVPIAAADLLDTRYTLDGHAVSADWPSFQLDGLGTWLWSLQRHLKRTARPIPPAWATAADLVATYLTALWDRPCYDCWEEFPDNIHTHTLAAIHGGLSAHQQLSAHNHQPTLTAICNRIHRDAVADGHFTKFLGSQDIDASLVGLATPYRVVDPEDPVLATTIKLIETKLRSNGGGLHRYPTDSFYGGGEWVVLAAWLGWHYAETGDHEGARGLLEWVEAQADSQGHLPEQVSDTLNVADQLGIWIDRWGPVARPLMWSHANYLILDHHLESA
jgi:GH15 family glucan-1,4-alpha-glucosidase